MSMRLNQKDIQIKKLWEKGAKSKGDIARRVGYGACIEDGIKRVTKVLIRLGLEKPKEYENA